MKNYYDILEVSKSADQDTIKQAYRTLSKKFHPDTYFTKTEKPSESEFKEIDIKFKTITEAYGILSDQEKRKQYNRLIFGESADTP